MKTTEEIRAALEHKTVLDDLRAVLATANGMRLFKYLFKHFDVAELPELGLEGNLLMDRLGFIRAGNSIFKLASEANPQVAGLLLAQKEKERYAELYGLDAESSEDGREER